MKRKLYNTAKRQQLKRQKSILIRTLKSVKKALKYRANKGQFIMTFSNLSGNWYTYIALRYLSRNSDLDMKFWDAMNGEVLCDECTVNWEL